MVSQNDIALVELYRPAEFDDFVQPVEYAQDSDTFSSNDVCEISGWGYEIIGIIILDY